MKQCIDKIIYKIWPLTSQCDLDLWRRVMIVVLDTPSYQSKHLYQIPWHYNYNFFVQTRFKLQNFDLWPLIMTFTFDIKSLVLYATCLHIIGNITNYNDDTTITWKVMVRSRYRLQNFDLWPLGVTLTFDKESWVLYVTCLHVRANISTKYHEDITITCKVKAQTRSKLQNVYFLPLLVWPWPLT